MSRSPRRANARVQNQCDNLRSERADQAAPVPDIKHRDIAADLRAAFKNESIQQQQDHGADDRHDPAGDVILARKDATDPRPNDRAGDAEQNRDDATTGISSRHQQFRDRTDDKTNKNGPNP